MTLEDVTPNPFPKARYTAAILFGDEPRDKTELLRDTMSYCYTEDSIPVRDLLLPKLISGQITVGET
jgi:hypothetical protein